MVNYLRRLQIYCQEKFKEFITTRTAIIAVIINSGIIASYQKNCIDSVIDVRSIAQIIFNSLILLTFIDVRVMNFFKLFAAGSLSHILTSEFISLYMRYIENYGTRCTIPIYIEGKFNIFVFICFTVGIFYWIFTTEDDEVKNKTKYQFPH